MSAMPKCISLGILVGWRERILNQNTEEIAYLVINVYCHWCKNINLQSEMCAPSGGTRLSF